VRKKKNNEVYIHYLNGIYAAITDGEFEAEAALRALACTAATLVLSKGLELGFLQEGVPTHEVVQRTADRIHHAFSRFKHAFLSEWQEILVNLINTGVLVGSRVRAAKY